MKKQKILIAVASLGFALVALPAFANETVASTTTERVNKGTRPVRILEKKDNIKDAKAKQNAEQEKRMKADEKKKNIAQHINKQLQELNAKRLKHFSNDLAQMEKVLVKVKARAEKAAAGGADMKAINAKIAAFEGAVATARAAIAAQSAKVYSVEITTTDGHLKDNTGVTRQALQKDLKAVSDLVKDAHEALKGITKELAKVRIAEKKEKHQTATTTATTTTNRQ